MTVTRFCLTIQTATGEELYRGCKNRFPTDIPTYLSGVVDRLHELHLDFESHIEGTVTQQYLLTVPEGSMAPTREQCAYVVTGSWNSASRVTSDAAAAR